MCGAAPSLYRDPEGDTVETLVTGGRCKLQWKPDWGMRWAALGVDYEMHGKDLTRFAGTLRPDLCDDWWGPLHSCLPTSCS